MLAGVSAAMGSPPGGVGCASASDGVGGVATPAAPYATAVVAALRCAAAMHTAVLDAASLAAARRAHSQAYAGLVAALTALLPGKGGGRGEEEEDEDEEAAAAAGGGDGAGGGDAPSNTKAGAATASADEGEDGAQDPPRAPGSSSPGVVKREGGDGHEEEMGEEEGQQPRVSEDGPTARCPSADAAAAALAAAAAAVSSEPAPTEQMEA